MRKKDIEIKPKKIKLIIALIIVIVYLICCVVRATSLIQNYYVNFVTLLVMQNTFNLILLVIALLTLYFAERKILINKINDYERGEN